MRVLVALLALCFAVPASAATYRYSVEGHVDSWGHGLANEIDPRTGEYSFRPAAVSTSDFDNLYFEGRYGYYRDERLKATRGEMIFEDRPASPGRPVYDRYTVRSCSGLLALFCFPPTTRILNLDPVSTADWGGYVSATITDTALSYRDDASPRFLLDGVNYVGSGASTGGVIIHGTITASRLELLSVPLSGSVSFLAFGAAALFGLRRKPKAA